ncbi:MAG TPA: hypothetical protein PK765_05975 [bacterium]|nr:hypothetical protein [bacterium]
MPEPPVAEFTPIVPAFPVTETIPAVPVRPIVPTPPVAETIPAAPVRSTIPISPVIETAPAARAFPMTEAIPTVLILPVTETVSSAPVHPIVSMSPAVETVAILPDVPREEATDRSDDESPQSVQGDVSEAPAETPLAGLSDMTSFPDPDAMSAPPFMRAKEGEIEDLTVPQRRPSGRKNAVPRVFPKFVSVFGSRDEADTCLRRFEVPLGG